jgi:hypothetical protein
VPLAWRPISSSLSAGSQGGLQMPRTCTLHQRHVRPTVASQCNAGVCRAMETQPDMSVEDCDLDSVTKVRHEMVALYWQAKSSRIEPAMASTLGSLLGLLARSLRESEAEQQAGRLEEGIEALRCELLDRGVELPPVRSMLP